MDIGKINGLNPGSTASSSVAQSSEKAKDDAFSKALQAAVDKKDDKALKNACQQFEGIMLDLVYKEMRATVMKSDLIPSDAGTDIYQSMLDEQLMSEASKTGSFGLAEILYKQLSRQNGTTETKPEQSVNDAGGKKAAENKPVEK